MPINHWALERAGDLAECYNLHLALIIAQLTITFHAYRAAHADPILALRDE